MAKKTFKVNEFSILHNSKFMAAMYFLISAPFAVLFTLISMFAPSETSKFPAWVMMFLPIVYAVFGFIFCAVGFAIYNWVAGLMSGGIEFTAEEE